MEFDLQHPIAPKCLCLKQLYYSLRALYSYCLDGERHGIRCPCWIQWAVLKGQGHIITITLPIVPAPGLA